MTEESQPFEDAFPIENWEFPASHVSFPGCNIEIIEAAASLILLRRHFSPSACGGLQCLGTTKDTM